VSKFDKVNVHVLGRCCVGTVQANPGVAAEGSLLSCPCGASIEYRAGRWDLSGMNSRPQGTGSSRGRIVNERADQLRSHT